MPPRPRRDGLREPTPPPPSRWWRRDQVFPVPAAHGDERTAQQAARQQGEIDRYQGFSATRLEDVIAPPHIGPSVESEEFQRLAGPPPQILDVRGRTGVYAYIPSHGATGPDPGQYPGPMGFTGMRELVDMGRSHQPRDWRPPFPDALVGIPTDPKHGDRLQWNAITKNWVVIAPESPTERNHKTTGKSAWDHVLELDES